MDVLDAKENVATYPWFDRLYFLRYISTILNVEPQHACMVSAIIIRARVGVGMRMCDVIAKMAATRYRVLAGRRPSFAGTLHLRDAQFVPKGPEQSFRQQ